LQLAVKPTGFERTLGARPASLMVRGDQVDRGSPSTRPPSAAPSRRRCGDAPKGGRHARYGPLGGAASKLGERRKAAWPARRPPARSCGAGHPPIGRRRAHPDRARRLVSCGGRPLPLIERVFPQEDSGDRRCGYAAASDPPVHSCTARCRPRQGVLAWPAIVVYQEPERRFPVWIALA
jgi:hypothetical protein